MIDRPSLVFITIAAASFIVVAIALKTRRMPGLTFRSRFIARRDQEPWLYWSSIGAVIVLGLISLFCMHLARSG